MENEKKALSNVPRGNKRASRSSSAPRRAELGSIAPRTKAQRARVASFLAGITVRRALLRDSSGTIERNAACSKKKKKKPTMVHYARTLRSALTQTANALHVPLILRDSPFTVSIIASLLFYWLKRGSCRQWIVTRVVLAGVKPSSRRQ